MFRYLCITTLAATPAKADSQHVDELLERLASPNAPIEFKGETNLETTPTVPRTYNRKAQQQIYVAWNELLQAGTTAFPALLRHFDDSRYSVTECNVRTKRWENLSVGDVCRTILSDQVDIYGSFFPTSTRWQEGFVHMQMRRAKSPLYWWKENQHKTLLEMQIESLDWALRVEERREQLELALQGGEDMDATLTEARIVGTLQYALKYLRQTKKPLLPPKRGNDPNRQLVTISKEHPVESTESPVPGSSEY